MSIFKKLGLFSDDEEESSKKVTPKAPVKNISAPTAAAPIAVTNTMSSESENYSEILENSLNEVDQPGADFLEFYKTLKGFQNQPLTDQQKYQLAFNALGTMGLTKAKIIETSPIYIKKIESEKAEFENNVKNFTDEQITAKQQESQNLQQENIELQKKMQENITRIGVLANEVATNQQKVTTKLQQFNVAIENEENIINTIINNVNTYL